MKLKRLVLALLVAALLTIPKPAFADGCNSISCTTSGAYVSWYWYVPITCYFSYTWYYDGSYYYYDTCGGGSSSLWIR